MRRRERGKKEKRRKGKKNGRVSFCKLSPIERELFERKAKNSV
jgi:hypothetical protein